MGLTEVRDLSLRQDGLEPAGYDVPQPGTVQLAAPTLRIVI